MLIQKDENSMYAGSLDVICILKDVNTGRFHCAFFEEHPFPGEIKPIEQTSVIRLKSKLHHTTGAATIEEAYVQLEEMKEKILVRPENIWLEPIEWNGEMGITWVVPNWLNKES